MDKLVSVLPRASISHITAVDPVTRAPVSCFLICKDAVELQTLMARLDGFEREQIAPPAGARPGTTANPATVPAH